MGTLARYHAANLPELFEKITRNSIGMDDYLNQFWDSPTTNSNYPPYNLIQVNNVESRLEIALAGFSKDEVKVYTEFGKLYVEGIKENIIEYRRRVMGCTGKIQLTPHFIGYIIITKTYCYD
jgi:molecular chaperone IbpA